MNSEPSFEITAVKVDGVIAQQLTVTSKEFLLNVVMNHEELASLVGISGAVWSERKSIRAGTTAGIPTFWSVENKYLSILIGHDDESWDIAFTFPETAVSVLLAALHLAQQGVAPENRASRVFG